MRVEEIKLKRPMGRGDRNVITFDERELVLVLFEAMLQISRPPDTTVEESLRVIRDHSHPEVIDGLKRMSQAALTYDVERMQHSEVEPLQ